MTLQDFKTRQGIYGKTIRLREWDNITFSSTGVIALIFDFENGNDVFTGCQKQNGFLVSSVRFFTLGHFSDVITLYDAQF